MPRSRYLRDALRYQMPVYAPIPLRTLAKAPLSACAQAKELPQIFLQNLLQFFGASTGFLCGSGTEALQLAISLAGREQGEAPAVALPAFGCFDLATAAVGSDARIALYDLEPVSLSPSMDSLERVFKAGVRIAVIAPLYGVPVQWTELEDLASRYEVILIEDAAQGHGASWAGRPLGSLGRYSALSFGRGKGWTGGGGGALLLRGGSSDFAPVVGARQEATFGEELATYLSSTGQSLLGHPSLYGIPAALPWLGLGTTRYRSPGPLREMPKVAVAMALMTWATAQQEASIRRARADELFRELANEPTLEPIRIPTGAQCGYLRLPMLIRGGLAALSTPDRARRLGMATGYPSTLAALPAVRARLTGPEGPWPGAELLVRDLITLPTHSKVALTEKREILKLIQLARHNHVGAEPSMEFYGTSIHRISVGPGST